MGNNTIEPQKKIDNFEKLRLALLDDGNRDDLCVLHQSFGILGNKWTLLVLGALVHGKKRNSDLQRDIPGISPKMLTETLKKLLEYNMIGRKVFPEVPPKVEYWLTDFGKSVADPVMALLNWTKEWKVDLSLIYDGYVSL